jgi:hypothetical protein
MTRNLPAVKLAMGSRNPYPIEELTASPPSPGSLLTFYISSLAVLISQKLAKCLNAA